MRQDDAWHGSEDYPAPKDQWYGQESTFAQWETDNGWAEMPPTMWNKWDTRLRRTLMIGASLLVWWVLGVLLIITLKGWEWLW